MLRHDAFEISLAGKCEHLLSSCLDVIAEQYALATLGQDGPEALLAFNERAVRQILAIAVQQVEGDEARDLADLYRSIFRTLRVCDSA